MSVKNKKVSTEKNSSVWTKAFRLFFLLCLTNAVGYIGSVFVTPEALAWYNSLIQSDLTPPDMWFGIVWTVLYFLMAVAAFLVWNRATPRFFVLQLAFSLIWPFVFFYLKEVVIALVIVLLMIYFVYRTIQTFGAVSKVSGWLMVPVLLWCCFAFYLNLIVVLYNTQVGTWFGLV